MADITWADVTALAAQLSVVSVTEQGAILAHVNTALEASFLDGEDAPRYARARIYLAAHFGEIARRKGQLGMVTSEEIGAESIRVAYMARLVLEPLQATPYGEQYLLIVGSTEARVGFTV